MVKLGVSYIFAQYHPSVNQFYEYWNKFINNKSSWSKSCWIIKKVSCFKKSRAVHICNRWCWCSTYIQHRLALLVFLPKNTPIITAEPNVWCVNSVRSIRSTALLQIHILGKASLATLLYTNSPFQRFYIMFLPLFCSVFIHTRTKNTLWTMRLFIPYLLCILFIRSFVST